MLERISEGEYRLIEKYLNTDPKSQKIICTYQKLDKEVLIDILIKILDKLSEISS